MIVCRVARFLVITAMVLLESRSEAATTAAVKLCGRQLSEIMSRVCHTYNSPSWDVPTVVEQPGAVRRRRHVGIADQCCIIGCTWDQLSEYCSVSAYSESPLEDMESHIIADRSAEQGAKSVAAAAAVPAAVGSAGYAGSAGMGAGGVRRGGAGSARRPRSGRCWCRRRRRSGRRRTSLMGNTGRVKSVVRAAPVVGTVSPLLTWGRTLNTDLTHANQHNYAYVVYT